MARTRRLIQALSSQMNQDNPRGFTQISLEATGVELGHVRFSSESENTPRCAEWRNNLTGLSQYHNLFFVAYRDEIHVYQPRFPNQELGHEPVMIIKPPVSAPGLPGHLDNTCPHAANYLLVDELGEEETLAIACDDGDVLLYHTRSIASKVSRKIECGAVDDDVAASRVNPFFHDNFSRSAWGLAMHKAARMLAVSSNTRNIDVIAFGLCSPKQRSSDGSSDENLELPQTEGSGSVSGAFTNPRSDEQRVTLRGHETNIPCVSFCSNRFDIAGKWLASTDVNGVLLVWDIWTQQIVARHQFGEFTRIWVPGMIWGERRRGWGVLCLDRSTFKITNGPRETYGSNDVAPLKPVDISLSRGEVKDSSPHFGFENPSNANEEVSSVEEDDDEEGSENDDEAENDGGNGGGVPFDWDNLPDIDIEQWLQAQLVDPDDPEYVETESESDHQSAHQSDLEDDEEGNDDKDGDGEEHDSHDEGGHPDNDQQEGQGVTTVDRRPIPYPPRFTILHTTETSVRLLSTPYTGPTVICREALYQEVPANLNILRQWERLNMISYIPELNLVVIGNQMGRVGLFTLTRDPESEPAAFRLEFIVPFASQEREGMRPARPLLGVAIGPIQGREKALDPHGFDPTSPRRNREQLWNKVEKTRRYRLMLTYDDHTVLSYEIGRVNNPSAGRDGGLTVA